MFRRNTTPHEPANKDKSTSQTPVSTPPYNRPPEKAASRSDSPQVRSVINIPSAPEGVPNIDIPNRGTKESSPQSIQAQSGMASTLAPSPHAITENESLKGIKEGSMSGFVGGGTMLTGEINFEAMLRIDGHFSGQINSEKGTLIVSSGGQVDGDISVGVAKINGTIKGDVSVTERVELGRSARLTGNIQTPALVVEQGALFDGYCRMDKTAPAEGLENVLQGKGIAARGGT